MRLPRILLAGSFLAGALQGQVMFTGEPGGVGDVLPLAIQTPDHDPELAGIQLLPIDCTGRTRATCLLTDRVQLVTDVPGGGRLVLPRDSGSLYHYRREVSQGVSFGFFRVHEGRARLVIERAAVPGSLEDPFLPKVAVGADGTSLLFGTVFGAGGDLIEVDLVSGSRVTRTDDFPRRSFGHDGLALLPGWGLGLSSEGPLRFRRTRRAHIEVLAMPDICTWFGDDVVSSRDGSTVAFLAGDSPDAARV